VQDVVHNDVNPDEIDSTAGGDSGLKSASQTQFSDSFHTNFIVVVVFSGDSKRRLRCPL